jgi:methyl-accepting chemotaxis protein
MEEQAKGVKQVTTSMERVNQMVHQIAKATNEQSKGSEQIIEATHRMKSITQGLQSVLQSHSKGMKKVTETVEEVSRLAQEIANATSDQKIQSEEIMHAIDQIKKVTHENVDTVGKVGFSVEELIQQAKYRGLNCSVGIFTTAGEPFGRKGAGNDGTVSEMSDATHTRYETPGRGYRPGLSRMQVDFKNENRD